MDMTDRIMTACRLCPRACGADRLHGETGVCGVPADLYAGRAMLHHWEEPCISGTAEDGTDGGAGAVFFSGCALGCVFCQNEVISHQDFGKPVTVARLREICINLIQQGAHNINLVNPSHYAHTVAQLLEDPLPVPVVWNSGGYDRVETLRALEGKVDIYLPDLKYLDSQTAFRYSNAADYPDVATAAIQEMVRQIGPVVLENGLLKRGVIIRHLILPGQASQAKAVMDWVNETFPRGTVLFSLMSQYTPWGELSQYPEINRRLRKGEMASAISYMQNLNLPGFCQERTSAKEEYTPPFDLTGI